MTPDERYGLQIAATACGIVGSGIAWYALFSKSWVRSDDTSHMTSIKKYSSDNNSLWLNDKTTQSRGLFKKCKTVEDIKFIENTGNKSISALTNTTTVDSVTCCSEYTSRDFPSASNMRSRILSMQQLCVWGVFACTVGAILLFVSMCHMSGNKRQNVRYAAVAFTALSFVLLVTCMGMFPSWSNETAFALGWGKAHASEGINAMAMAITLTGISCIFIGISTHKTNNLTKLKVDSIQQ